MAINTPVNAEFNLPSQPLFDLIPESWRKTDEYDELLHFLGNLFSPFHDAINRLMDFYDPLKQEIQLEALAYNLGIEIPKSEALRAYAKRAVLYALTVYKGKGTFNPADPDSQGIGLWIKALTGYDITMSELALINPLMFFNQENYRCVKRLTESGSEDTTDTAVHPYEKELDGLTPRVMYLDELPKYATDSGQLWNGFGLRYYDTDNDAQLALLDMDTQTLLSYTTPTLPGVTFAYDNLICTLSITPELATLTCYEPATAQTTEYTDVVTPANTNAIEMAGNTSVNIFRNCAYFLAFKNDTAALNYIYKFDMLTRELSVVRVIEDANVVAACFDKTKIYWYDPTDDIIYVYDVVKDNLHILLADFSFTPQAVVFYKGNLFFAVNNTEIHIFNIYSELWRTITITFPYTYTAGTFNLSINRDYLFIAKRYGNNTHAFIIDARTLLNVELIVLNLSSMIPASPSIFINAVGDTVHEDMTVRGVSWASHSLLGSFPAFITAGRVTYPLTLIINIDSHGEFTTARLKYAAKMQIINAYIDRYVQAGVLPIINDDNPNVIIS